MDMDFKKLQVFINLASDNMNREEILTVVCMLIDTVSARENEDAVEIAETISALVKQVNSEMGAYQLS